MWILYAILVHTALLGSIFVIYFRSPVITGLHPQEELENPPAKRLVLIVTDGLRAESFFKNQCNDIPHIRRLISQQGLVGISQTRVPTESRPGHIALIAGLYEDPSAVLRGWKANPIDFDNVFNRSSHTYAWGAMDVLHIFSKITAQDKLMIDAYDEYDFTGTDDSWMVDQWVFERVRRFLSRKAEELRVQTRSVFFLHLLGLDIAGHIHKPGSKLFLDTLHSTEKGVYQMYELFESTFTDKETAYILTSDHGMTNHGSHGAGDILETETPFFVWGAGINNWEHSRAAEQSIEIDGNVIPLVNIEQGQMAPLMSALIGLPPPMNSFGTLPKGVLNVSSEYSAAVTHSNALQLVAQLETLITVFDKGSFSKYMPSFKRLDSSTIDNFRRRVDEYIHLKNFKQVIDDSYLIMQDALDGIDYYHNYYQKVLLFCTSLTFLIWMFCLITFTITNKRRASLNLFAGPMIVAIPSLAFILLQRIPLEVGFYMLLPLALWVLALSGYYGKQRWVRSQMTAQNAFMMLIVISGAVFMVTSFFKRQYITLVFVLFLSLKFKTIHEQGNKFYTWIIISLLLAVFPLLPAAMGYKNDHLLLLGALLTLGRGLLVKSNIPSWMYLVAFGGLVNAAFCIIKHTNHEPTPFLCRLISWLFLLHSLAAPFYVATTSLKTQVELVFFSLTTAYLLLCTSYEALFIVLLGSQLMLTFSERKHFPVDYLNTKDLTHSFQYALAILLYTLFAFFGTGNIASVSSFDPNVMRCFLTNFSPWIIMGLVILKLFLPMLLNVAIIYGTVGPVLNERRVFIAMLFICDVMGLQFLYLVQNKGSWLEIGSSISHFVIMEVTTLVLVATTYVVRKYLRMQKSAESAYTDEKIK